MRVANTEDSLALADADLRAEIAERHRALGAADIEAHVVELLPPAGPHQPPQAAANPG
jgi:hypothetical protein